MARGGLLLRTMASAGKLLIPSLLLLGGVVLGGVVLSGSEPRVPEDRPLPGPALVDRAETTPLRLAAFGTSLTAGALWPSALATRLASCLGRPVEVVSVARPGAGSAWGLGAVPQVAATGADIIVMEFAINDADLLDGVSPATGAAQHRALVRALRLALPEGRIVLLTTNPATGWQQLKRPFLARHYAGVRAVATELDTGLADFAPRWRMIREDWSADGLHPDGALAAALMAQVLAEIIAPGCGAGG